MGADFTTEEEPDNVDGQEAANQIPVSIGAATRPISEGEPNGDSFVSKSWNESTLVGVIDGLGHGPRAHKASTAAREYVESHVERSLDSIFRGVDRACIGTRGVVMALAKFDWTAGTITFANVGNINVRVAGPEWTGFIVRRGVLGGNNPEVSVVTRDWQPSFTLALFSDGISTRWKWQDIRNGEPESAATLANRLLEEYGKSDDDATALVVTQTNDRPD
ncbi:SpoIIE family protein phosphatase [Halodesulfurarchaeum sp. HSR-GB]|uniref:SpoIIE family protein phosphatase n=1 Tax=Halodesulfurarchaeum sp. HSR-GB TaxID=3074077 RepID=UPI002854781C|nr:SpoIIE family protein phosphatase [Halodesulfurarchaeum sp. HSR-GB]MDR5657712.1 SpoIIE family protein phosphatase [Halodesulfurarchaeum sp. HSR-GB]